MFEIRFSMGEVTCRVLASKSKTARLKHERLVYKEKWVYRWMRELAVWNSTSSFESALKSRRLYWYRFVCHSNCSKDWQPSSEHRPSLSDLYLFNNKVCSIKAEVVDPTVHDGMIIESNIAIYQRLPIQASNFSYLDAWMIWTIGMIWMLWMLWMPWVIWIWSQRY